MPFQHRLSEAALVGNAMLTINGATPYNCVYGRVPHLLPDANAALPDRMGNALTRDANRLREVAIQAMVEGTAAARVQRALRTRTQRAVQEEFNVGDEVEFHRDPTQKDLPGWNGPAVITDMSDAERGTIKVQFNGREILVTPPDLRKAFTLFTFLSAPHLLNHHDRAYQSIRRWQDTLPANKIITLGHTLTHGRWTTTEATSKHPAAVAAITHLAAVTLGLTQVIAARCGREVPVIPGVSDYASTLLMTWPMDRPDDRSFHDFPAIAKINMRQSFGDSWTKIRWLQLHTQAVGDYPAAEEGESRTAVTHDAGGGRTAEAHGGSRTAETIPRLPPIPEGSHEDSDSSPGTADISLLQAIEQLDHDTRGPEETHYVYVGAADDSMLELEGATISNFAAHASVPDEIYHIRSANARVSTSGRVASMPLHAASAEAACTKFPGNMIIRIATNKVAAVSYMGTTGIISLNWSYMGTTGTTGFKQINERDTDLLTPEEVRKHSEEAKAAMLSELKQWAKLGCISRKRRQEARNIVSSRWVYKWKYEESPDGSRTAEVQDGSRTAEVP